jgi:hypothetical protein
VTLDNSETTIRANLAQLTPKDRELAEAQKYCPVHGDHLLGSMGKPIKVVISLENKLANNGCCGKPVVIDKTVFVCCKECVTQAKATPEETVAKVYDLLMNHSKIDSPVLPAASASDTHGRLRKLASAGPR